MEKSGTREWSDVSANAGDGCPHGCLYCYARYNAVCRFKLKTAEEWAVFQPNLKKIDGPVKKVDGIVMFPTTHDITPENLSECMTLMRKHLDQGNRLLITSKPHWQCITVICNAYLEYKSQILFRFTIGTINSLSLAFWEPGAPSADERLACLQYAFEMGYETSVSCEPFLDKYVNRTYNACINHITNSFWVGKLNNFKSRVKVPNPFNSDFDRRMFYNCKAAQSDENVRKIYELLKDKPLIKFKNSFRKVIGI